MAFKQPSLLDAELVTAQIAAVAEDLPVAASKTGMLGSSTIIAAVAKAVERHRLTPLVVDPVMIAKSGDPLIDEQAMETLRECLLPLATVVTPNLHETMKLLERSEPISDMEAAADAAREICHRFGVATCVVKGVRTSDDAGSAQMGDVYSDGCQVHQLIGAYHPEGGVHGSGCAYAAAITAALAHNKPLDDALDMAKQFITTAIAHGHALGGGTRPVNPLAWINMQG